MDDYRERVGRRIRQTRERRSLSQTELARLMEVSDAQISRWERGRVMPSPRHLEGLGRALGVPAETFLYDEHLAA